MKKAIAILSVLLVGGFLTHFTSASKSTFTEKNSPAYSVALDAAVKTLEGVTSAATTGVRVAEAKGGASAAPTFDPLTCDPNNPWCRYITTDPLHCYITYQAGLYTCEAQTPTCDAKPTCQQYYTCDSRQTCNGEPTCDGNWTCWNSTCNPAGTPDGLTCDGTFTCDKGPVCEFTVDGSYTCNGTPECVPNTCNGWPTCGASNPRCQPSDTEKTSWGDLKARFKS